MLTKTMEKGDLGVAKVIVDLIEKGYIPFRPVVCESLPFDLVAYKDGNFIRIQSKYTSNGTAAAFTAWADSSGTHIKHYGENDFDYFALYLPQVDKVIYPSIKFRGAKFRTSPLENSAAKFYWWEDFINFTDNAEKKSYKDFGIENPCAGKEHLNQRKVIRPIKNDLLKMIWEKPTTELSKEFGVSDKAIERWTKSYKIPKPPRGYWMKPEEERIIIKNNALKNGD
jgi:hypothetical protein